MSVGSSAARNVIAVHASSVCIAGAATGAARQTMCRKFAQAHMGLTWPVTRRTSGDAAEPGMWRGRKNGVLGGCHERRAHAPSQMGVFAPVRANLAAAHTSCGRAGARWSGSMPARSADFAKLQDTDVSFFKEVSLHVRVRCTCH
jgi:hypothetical protein